MAKVVTDGDIGSGLEIVDDKLIRSAITKADVGLGNVDNTSDFNKPISSATQTALDEKQNTISGTANYVAKFGSVGVVQSQVFDNGVNVGIGTTNNVGLLNLRTETDNNISIINRMTGGVTISSFNDAIDENRPLEFAASQHIFSKGNILVNTTTNNGLDKLQVNGSVSIETFAYLKPSTVPSTLREGTVYYDSSSKKIRCWDGTTWNDLF